MTRAQLELRGDCDADAYRSMAIDFRRNCVDFPHINKVLIARNCGARAFGISIDDLLSKSRSPLILQPRQKLMAAIHVIMPNASMYSIARCFGRDHSCMYRACELHAARVREALAVRGLLV